jgi:hypothetical protein
MDAALRIPDSYPSFDDALNVIKVDMHVETAAGTGDVDSASDQLFIRKDFRYTCDVRKIV